MYKIFFSGGTTNYHVTISEIFRWRIKKKGSSLLGGVLVSGCLQCSLEHVILDEHVTLPFVFWVGTFKTPYLCSAVHHTCADGVMFTAESPWVNSQHGDARRPKISKS